MRPRRVEEGSMQRRVSLKKEKTWGSTSLTTTRLSAFAKSCVLFEEGVSGLLRGPCAAGR